MGDRAREPLILSPLGCTVRTTKSAPGGRVEGDRRGLTDWKESAMKQATGMTKAEAVRRLDALNGYDAEVDHGTADHILLEFVPLEIRRAWNRANDRVGFWYA